MIKKFIAAVLAAGVFLVMLGSLINVRSWQVSQITSKYILKTTSSKNNLAVYFKEAYRTRASIASLFTYNRKPDDLVIDYEKLKKQSKETKKEKEERLKREAEEEKKWAIKTFCQDALLDASNIDACLLTISLFNSNYLNSDLTYDPQDVKELDLDGRYSKGGWDNISSWLQEVVNSFVNLKSISVWDYGGDELFSITRDIDAFKVYNNKKLLLKKNFEKLPRTISTLTYRNSHLRNISELSLERFTNLIHLDLSKNDLTSIHSDKSDFGVANLISLKTFNASNNEIQDISGLYRTNALPNRFMDINLSYNKIKEADYGNTFLLLKNGNLNINFSHNQIVAANKIFNNIKFSSTLNNDFKTLGITDLSMNKITALPNKAAEISHTLKLYGNKLENFLPIQETAKLKKVLMYEDDLKKDIWKKELFTDGKVMSIKREYLKWFLAKGKSFSSPLNLSVLQEAYIDKVLLPVAVKLYMTNVIVENPKAIIATVNDLAGKELGDAALDVKTVKETLNSPTNVSEFNVFASLATNGINKEVVQAYTNYVNYRKILDNMNSNTNTALSKTTLIIVIALSIVGILIAAGFIGTYFFGGNKKRKEKGDF